MTFETRIGGLAIMVNNDRNGKRLHLGDKVKLTTGMAVEGHRLGIIENIDGMNITVRLIGNKKFDGILIHRYGSELEIV